MVSATIATVMEIMGMRWEIACNCGVEVKEECAIGGSIVVGNDERRARPHRTFLCSRMTLPMYPRVTKTLIPTEGKTRKADSGAVMSNIAPGSADEPKKRGVRAESGGGLLGRRLGALISHPHLVRTHGARAGPLEWRSSG